MFRRTVIFSWLVAATVTGLAEGRPPERRVYRTARVAAAPPVVDGRLNDPAWEQVPWSGDFTVHTPNEGARPTEATSFKILYDDRNVYVGIRLFDSQPDRVERRPGRRDQYTGDDVAVWFDSYFDRRTAFAFAVNAAGVKWDGVTAEDGRTTDTSWDPIWFVATSIDETGWTAEMRIPLTQLRFAEQGNEVWGLQVSRSLYRRQELSEWQAIPGRAGGHTSRYGELHGLTGLRSRTQVELLPYGVGQVERAPAQPGNPFETGQSWRGVAGLDGKVGLSSNVTLDFTVNPDFGQVEADPSVVNLTAFETFYQEKRPFFVEGSRVFDMAITSWGTSAMDRLFYSRRIGRPPHVSPSLADGEFADVPDRTSILGAAKVTGRTRSGWSLGLLDSVTRSESATVEFAGTRRSQAVEPLTNYFVGRVQKDYRRGQTTIGGLLTAVNRRLGEPQFGTLHDSAYTGGVDIAHYWADRAFYARGTAVFSYVHGSAAAIARTQQASPRFFQRPDAGYLRFDPTRRSLAGNGGSLEVGRSGNSRFLFNGSIAWRSPGLELNDLGYQRTADYIVSRLQTQYNVYQPFWIFRTFNASGAVWANWLYSGDWAGTGGYVAANGQFRNYWRLNGSVETNTDYLDATVLRGGPAMLLSARTNINVNLQSDTRKRIFGTIGGMRVSDPNGEEDQRTLAFSLSGRPTTGVDVSVQPNITWRDPRLQYVGVATAGSNRRYILSSLQQRTVSVTARLNYAVTPTLTVQFYGQPFVSAGQYRDFKVVADPRAAVFGDRFRLLGSSLARAGGRLSVDENADGTTDYALPDPDYGFRQFRSNLVVRWEYSPGSTLFVVWSQGRTGSDASGRFAFASGMRDLFGVRPENVFLVKFSRWIAW
jgi:hypothetical protein